MSRTEQQNGNVATVEKTNKQIINRGVLSDGQEGWNPTKKNKRIIESNANAVASLNQVAFNGIAFHSIGSFFRRYFGSLHFSVKNLGGG